GRPARLVRRSSAADRQRRPRTTASPSRSTPGSRGDRRAPAASILSAPFSELAADLVVVDHLTGIGLGEPTLHLREEIDTLHRLLEGGVLRQILDGLQNLL